MKRKRKMNRMIMVFMDVGMTCFCRRWLLLNNYLAKSRGISPDT